MSNLVVYDLMIDTLEIQDTKCDHFRCFHIIFPGKEFLHATLANLVAVKMFMKKNTLSAKNTPSSFYLDTQDVGSEKDDVEEEKDEDTIMKDGEFPRVRRL